MRGRATYTKNILWPLRQQKSLTSNLCTKLDFGPIFTMARTKATEKARLKACRARATAGKTPAAPRSKRSPPLGDAIKTAPPTILVDCGFGIPEGAEGEFCRGLQEKFGADRVEHLASATNDADERINIFAVHGKNASEIAIPRLFLNRMGCPLKWPQDARDQGSLDGAGAKFMALAGL